ncbi:erythromycin esterase family protein [Nonlabens antarcticus]|uniref:erythromycin esterase family protein n=1 Tax=Nonlabens antarcticus TaxID=392714 RepID=UPI00189108CD|nr:erythromycin esterase family protein [Nonlabens antarcticus]
MKKTILLLFIIFGLNSIRAQVEKSVYELNNIKDLITDDVKAILDTRLNDKKVVFLGESNHYFGSDLLAKTEFVKYLVLEEGYKDIAFEADFFGLYFDHNNNVETNLYAFWSRSVQGKELFEFLREHQVTIWGFDNQMGSGYTNANFTNKLSQFLTDNFIVVDDSFIELTERFVKNRSDANEIVGVSNLGKLENEIEKLLKNEKVIQDPLWYQFLESFKSDLVLNSTHKSSGKGTPVRDAQMAKNLDFLVRTMPEKKFVVWLHNAHMIKDDYGTQNGQTMGFQFVTANPDISYHVAFSSINMPYRKPKWIARSSKDKGNLLQFLPSTEQNYFIDSQQIISNNPDYGEKEYDGMFVVEKDKLKTNWFRHYDALVFISKGEDVTFKE